MRAIRSCVLSVDDGSAWRDFGRPERLWDAATVFQCGARIVAGYTCRRNDPRCARRRSAEPEFNTYAGTGANEPLRGPGR